MIGIACRFPGGADTPNKFWDLLTEGVDAIVQAPPSRWEAYDFLDKDLKTPGKMYTAQGGFLKDDIEQIAKYDPEMRFRQLTGMTAKLVSLYKDTRYCHSILVNMFLTYLNCVFESYWFSREGTHAFQPMPWSMLVSCNCDFKSVYIKGKC